MCGIAGIVSPNSSLVQQQRLQQMADVLQHRGPDGEGFWIDEQQQIGFGHRRLCIIDRRTLVTIFCFPNDILKYDFSKCCQFYTNPFRACHDYISGMAFSRT